MHHIYSLFWCFPFLVVLPTLFSPLTSGAPASSLIHPLTFPSNSSIYTQNPIRIHCVGSESWIVPRFSGVHDCADAVDRLYLTDYGRFSTRNFEFLAADTTPASRHLTTQFTPRRYTIGSCTVAVVMLADFPVSQPFPGQPPGPHPARDISNYEKVWEAAGRISAACVTAEQFGGWEAVGRDGGIGVFIWSRGSEIDRAVGRSP